ncbi:hypothetical protein [Luteolibacter sp. AS25]|uniref:hypothetical protein n=1 Tax=Luteolibacter sp. AS25 TaxID=3135776 RepID=UPI00398AD04E
MKDKKIVSNPQPTSADESPIPQPPTDGFPVGEDLTDAPGGEEELKEDKGPD